jgi:hypothetical protein
MLTAARLRELLHYDPETGIFTHIARRQSVVVGTVAGNNAPNGYRKHKIEGRSYTGHRLAWLYLHGDWPVGDVDHINGIRHDNRIANLRDVSRKTNRENMRVAHGAVGLLGVSIKGKKFRADIGVDNKNVMLGIFDTPEEAHAAYVHAKRQFHAGCTI